MSNAEEKHEGVSTKIRERLQHAKEEAKEKVNPWSKTNKENRQERNERKKELAEAQREAYEKEEIKQATERGKHIAEKRFAPKQSVTKKASNFVEGTRRSTERSVYSRGPSMFAAPGGTMGYFDMFGSQQKKKPVPQRTTVINPRTGKVTVTEPIEQPKKQEHEQWSPFDTLTIPNLHTAHSTNPFDIEIRKQNKQPFGKGKNKKTKHKKAARQWRIGDLA